MQTLKLCAHNADAVRYAMDWHVEAKHPVPEERAAGVHL